MHVGIVGAGSLGLMAALRLAQSGNRVTVLERDGWVGGLAANCTIGGGPIERFYHHIFKTDTHIAALIEELGLGDRLIWGQPATTVRSEGQTAQLDSPVAVLKYPLLSIPDRLRLGMIVAYLSPDRLEPYTAAEWLRKAMGKAVYQKIWEPQLRSKFGVHAPTVAMPWFWARIHDRTTSLGYLRGGFGQVYERMAGRVETLGGEVRLRTPVKQIGRDESGPFVETHRGYEHFDQLLVTLPTSLFIKLAPDLPENYRQQYGGSSPHLSAHNVLLGLKGAVQSAYWVSIAEQGYPFLALVEHTNFLPKADYGDQHVVYLGNYLPADDALFGMSDYETLQYMLPGLRKFNPAIEQNWIMDAVVSRAPFAQPIVTRGYRDRQPPFETPWSDVRLANMGMVYPHDRGQNYSLVLGEDVAEQIMRQPANPRAKEVLQHV